MDHIELLGGVLTGEGQDGELTTGVVGQELGDVQHLAVDDDLAVVLRDVLLHFGQRNSGTSGRRGGGTRKKPQTMS